MSARQRVFMTGLSALTAAGATADATWQAILNQESHLRPIQQWDLSRWPHYLGGELTDFQPAKMLPDRKLIKVISRQDAMGIHAAIQAVEHSQLLGFRDTLNDPEPYNAATGVYVGSPGNKYFQQYDFLPLLAKTKGDMRAFGEQLFAEVHPMWLLRILPNNVLAYTGITYGFKGPNHNVTNHAVSGTQALLEAYHAIASGQIERAVVVAYDIGIEPQALFYYDRLGVLSARHLKPFDAAHDGTILAEGAAAIVLESEASAAQRQAICYGEILGGQSNCEAHGLFSLEAEGQHLAALLQQALQQQQLQPDDIDLLVAHGNGNQKSDISEAQAIQTIWSQTAVPVTAFKWAMGHTLCTSGVLDAVLSSYALRANCVPGIANLQQRASTCAIDASATTRPLRRKQSTALLISRGFGSMNTCLLIRAA